MLFYQNITRTCVFRMVGMYKPTKEHICLVDDVLHTRYPECGKSAQAVVCLSCC